MFLRAQNGDLFEWLDLPLSDAVAQRMERYLATEWRHGPGTHRYSPADFGITRQGVDDAFAPYLDRFAVTKEPA